MHQMNLMSQTDTARDHERLRNMENLEKELELIRRDNDNYKGDLTDKVSIINHLQSQCHELKQTNDLLDLENRTLGEKLNEEKNKDRSQRRANSSSHASAFSTKNPAAANQLASFVSPKENVSILSPERKFEEPIHPVDIPTKPNQQPWVQEEKKSQFEDYNKRLLKSIEKRAMGNLTNSGLKS